jgi:hypothetical protein
MRHERRLREAAPIAGLLLLVAGCGPGGPIALRLQPEVQRPQRGVVLFICDGMSVDLVSQGCAEGWLPNFRQRFVESGLRVEHAVTCVPSITYAILTTFATGVRPARHGVVANHWFDRRLRLLREYAFIKHYREVNGDFSVPTIYERLPPKVSVSIQDPVHRGVTKNVANWAQSGVRWFFHDFTAVDKLTATTLEYVVDWANHNGVWPDLLVCYFPGIDAVGHAYGVNSERYRRAVEHVDYQVGRVCDWLESERLLETTTLILVADHGMVPVDDDGVIDLMKCLRKDMGRRATETPLQGVPFEDRYHHFKRFDTVLAKSAVRFAAIHFRGRLGWDDPLTPEEVRAILETPPAGRRLWDHPGVDLIAYALSDSEVELRSPRGTAQIVERAGPDGLEYRYVPVPDDVLGYVDDANLAQFVAAGFHPPRAWLRATRDQVRPGVVPHLVPLLRACRGGDVVLFATHGYSFAREKSGHGGIHRDEMRIPMMFAGPGIEPGSTLDVACAADLAPTILTLLGCELPDDGYFDGVSLLPAPAVPEETAARAAGFRLHGRRRGPTAMVLTVHP